MRGLNRGQNDGTAAPAGRLHQVARCCLTLGIALVCALIAVALHVPLPWILGPLIGTAALNMSGLRFGSLTLGLPDRVRMISIPVLGIMIASSVDPGTVRSAISWWPSLLAIIPYVIVLQLLNFLVFRTFGGYDRATAYFAASPGGLLEATLLGSENGGSASRIVLQHSARVILAVLTVPVLMSFLGFSYTRPPQSDLLQFDYTVAELPQFVALGICAFVGIGAARRLKLPAPLMIGPFFLAGTLYGTGLVDLAMPILLIDLAQLLIGVVLGTRFGPRDRTLLLSGAGTSILALVSSYGLALLAALGLSLLGVASFPLVFLSYTPGGMTEMSMIAVALGIDPVFVATHHLARIVVAVTFSPLIFRYFIARDDTAKGLDGGSDGSSGND